MLTTVQFSFAFKRLSWMEVDQDASYYSLEIKLEERYFKVSGRCLTSIAVGEVAVLQTKCEDQV